MGGKKMIKEDSWQQIAEREFREQQRLTKLEKDKRQRYFEKKRRKEEFRRLDRMMLRHAMNMGGELK